MYRTNAREEGKSRFDHRIWLMPLWRLFKCIAIVPYSILWWIQEYVLIFPMMFAGYIISDDFERFLTSVNLERYTRTNVLFTFLHYDIRDEKTYKHTTYRYSVNWLNRPEVFWRLFSQKPAANEDNIDED